jgi:DNA adenine methylase
MLVRYPGGKSRGALSKKILELIKENYTGGIFAEPFFGGGGITFHLLKSSSIEKLAINDLDRHVYLMWKEVIENPKAFSREVVRFTPSVKSFLAAKSRIIDGEGSGFDMLVCNRLSHGGRGSLAGPQGGFDQTGKYKIGCRWNVSKLCSEIKDAHDLLTSVPITYTNKHYSKVDGDYYYLDPPYYEVGNDLYPCYFTLEDHQNLYNFLGGHDNWLLSYNNNDVIRNIYRKYTQGMFSTAGNGGTKRNSELIIMPKGSACTR